MTRIARATTPPLPTFPHPTEAGRLCHRSSSCGLFEDSKLGKKSSRLLLASPLPSMLSDMSFPFPFIPLAQYCHCLQPLQRWGELQSCSCLVQAGLWGAGLGRRQQQWQWEGLPSLSLPPCSWGTPTREWAGRRTCHCCCPRNPWTEYVAEHRGKGCWVVWTSYLIQGLKKNPWLLFLLHDLKEMV